MLPLIPEKAVILRPRPGPSYKRVPPAQLTDIGPIVDAQQCPLHIKEGYECPAPVQQIYHFQERGKGTLPTF